MNAVPTPTPIGSKILSFRVQPKAEPTTPTVGVERTTAAPTSVPLTSNDPSRRLKFKPVEGVVKGSARWVSRPELPDGNAAWSFKLNAPEAAVYVTVGHYTNGTNHPFEVFVNTDAPRGLGPLPRLLSRVMRSTDRAWVRKNLSALQKVKTKPFALALPHGVSRHVGGLVAAFAAVIEHRCMELGFFDGADDATSPMLSARMCEKEPKGDVKGFTTFSFHVLNTITGDDGLVTLKEGLSEDGKIVPLSVWFAGHFEPEWEGLAKVLSLQMQICDLSLIATTLQELEALHEPHREYGWAGVPGKEDKQHYYLSTLAYIATLLRARYQELGLFGDDGMPAMQIGLFERDSVPTRHVSTSILTQPAIHGDNCGKCGAVGMVVLASGCRTCLACGDSKCS